MNDVSERRDHPRIEVEWPIALYFDDEIIEGTTKNITTDGIYICCNQPLPLDKVFRVSITPPNHQAVGVTGKVVWSDLYGLGDGKDVFGVGICLVEMSDKDRHYLNELVLLNLKK